MTEQEKLSTIGQYALLQRTAIEAIMFQQLETAKLNIEAMIALQPDYLEAMK